MYCFNYAPRGLYIKLLYTLSRDTNGMSTMQPMGVANVNQRDNLASIDDIVLEGWQVLGRLSLT